MAWLPFFSGARTDLEGVHKAGVQIQVPRVFRHPLCRNVGVNVEGDKLFIAYKKIAKMGHEGQGVDQNGARKHHFCA
jgi:hypothetical protein